MRNGREQRPGIRIRFTSYHVRVATRVYKVRMIYWSIDFCAYIFFGRLGWMPFGWWCLGWYKRREYHWSHCSKEYDIVYIYCASEGR